MILLLEEGNVNLSVESRWLFKKVQDVGLVTMRMNERQRISSDTDVMRDGLINGMGFRVTPQAYLASYLGYLLVLGKTLKAASSQSCQQSMRVVEQARLLLDHRDFR
jgi:hypothetical protein